MIHSTAFFDFDDTIIEGDTILYWKAFYFRKYPYRRFFQVINFLSLILNILKLIPSRYFKLILFWPLCFESTKNRDILAKDFFSKHIKSYLFPTMVSKIEEHHKKGDQVVIISASHIFYLQELKNLFPFAHIVGTNISFEKKFPYYKEWGNMKHETKVRYIQKQKYFPKDGRNCYAYSDSHVDLPLLSFVEFPFIIHPTKKLKIIAQQKKWIILPAEIKRKPIRKFFLLLFDIDIQKTL